jgi:hypothetical protein
MPIDIKTASKKRCGICGRRMRWHSMYMHDDPLVGRIIVHGIPFQACDCGHEIVPTSIFQGIEDEIKFRLPILLERLVTTGSNPVRFLTTSDAAELLEISPRKLLAKGGCRTMIYSMFRKGRLMWLRDSVERFLRCGDGRFPLVTPMQSWRVKRHRPSHMTCRALLWDLLRMDGRTKLSKWDVYDMARSVLRQKRSLEDLVEDLQQAGYIKKIDDIAFEITINQQ